MEQTNKNKEIKKYFSVFFTLFTWIIVGVVVIWHIIVLLWVILSFGVPNDIYLSESVRTTSYYMLALLVWIAVVTIISKMWGRYNKNKKILKVNKSCINSNQLLFIEKDIQWTEASISNINTKKILNEIDKVKENLSILTYKTSALKYERNYQPKKLLNKANILIKQGQFLNGISYLRVILDHPDATDMIKNIAKIKLSQCLYNSGYEEMADILMEKII